MSKVGIELYRKTYHKNLYRTYINGNRSNLSCNQIHNKFSSLPLYSLKSNDIFDHNNIMEIP